MLPPEAAGALGIIIGFSVIANRLWEGRNGFVKWCSVKKYESQTQTGDARQFSKSSLGDTAVAPIATAGLMLSSASVRTPPSACPSRHPDVSYHPSSVFSFSALCVGQRRLSSSRRRAVRQCSPTLQKIASPSKSCSNGSPPAPCKWNHGPAIRCSSPNGVSSTIHYPASGSRRHRRRWHVSHPVYSIGYRAMKADTTASSVT